MKLLSVVVSIAFLILLGGIIYGFVYGGGWGELRELLNYPWFIVSMIDIYIGFLLFACWIGSRERPLASAIWILLLLSLGNLIACAYVLYALWTRKRLPLDAPSAA